MCRSSRIHCGCRNASGLFEIPRTLIGCSASDSAVKQPGDRTCTTEAIGGDHFGPVQAYMTKVTDASTADGSTGWFKIYVDGWSPLAGATDGAGDNWGTKDMNNCCGKVALKIPSDIPAGDYLLRAEVIALHVAGSLDGAQFYMSCCMSRLFSLCSFRLPIFKSLLRILNSAHMFL